MREPVALHLINLELRDWRCHAGLRMTPGPAACVVLQGTNGSGKTSILEAVYVAVRGRSFRTGRRGGGIRRGQPEATILLRSGNEREHLLGVVVRRGEREAHLDGEKGASVAAAAQAIPVEYVSGDAYRLVGGARGQRRQFLDWVLFHVEPRFWEAWQVWHRAHRQRNRILRIGGGTQEARFWEPTIGESGEILSALRERVVQRINEALEGITPVGWLGRVELRFRRGWQGERLEEALQKVAGREAQAGRALIGPQCDDWSLTVDGVPTDGLSRGQAKLASVVLFRAQADLMAAVGREPLLLVDDLAGDLDAQGLESAMVLLRAGQSQVWLTFLPREVPTHLLGGAAVFHVEPGEALRR